MHKRLLTLCTALLLGLCSFSQQLVTAEKRFLEYYAQVAKLNHLRFNTAIQLRLTGNTLRSTPVKGKFKGDSVLFYDPSIVSIADTTYYPRISDDFSTTYRQQGFAVIQPSTYPIYKTIKKFPVWIIVHGIGERSEGRLENLRNLVQGFDYSPNKTGPRLYPLVTPDLTTAVNQYGFLAVVVTYQGEFNPVDFNFVLNEVERLYSVDTNREAIIGFSLGGGAVSRYITSSLENANRLALAVACAPVNWATTYANPSATQLPVIVNTAQSDPTVSPSNAKAITAGLKNAGDKFVTYIEFPYTGHTGLNEMLSLQNQYVPENMYSYLNRLTKDVPLIYGIPNGGGSGTTTPPPATTGPVIIRDPVPAVTSTGTVSLNACKTTGIDWLYWTVISVPKSASLYTPYISNSGNCAASAKFTIEGAYGITATAIKGSLKTVDTFYVTYQKTTQPVPRLPVSFENGLLTFSDGSQEKAQAVINWKTKEAKIISVTGITYIYP